MALVEEISAKLGLNVSDFRAALADANADVKKFKDSGSFGAHEGLAGSVHEIHSAMRQLHQFILAGGIFEAVKGFFEMAIKNAEDTKGKLDENYQAVVRLGAAFKDNGSFLKNWATEALGFFAKGGEAIGVALRFNYEWLTSSKSLAQVQQDMIKNYAIELQTQQTLKDIGDARAKQAAQAKTDSEYEKQLNADIEEAVEQKNAKAKVAAADAKKHKEEIAELDKEIAKNKFDDLTTEQKITALVAEREALTKQIAAKGTDEITKKKDLIRLHEVDKQLEKDRADIAKQIVNTVVDESAAVSTIISDWTNFSEQFSRTGSGDLTKLTDAQLAEQISNFKKEIFTTQNSPTTNEWLTNAYVSGLQAQLSAAQNESATRFNFRTVAGSIGDQAALGQQSAFDQDRFEGYLKDGANAQRQTNDNLTSIAQTLAGVFPEAARATNQYALTGKTP